MTAFAYKKILCCRIRGSAFPRTNLSAGSGASLLPLLTYNCHSYAAVPCQPAHTQTLNIIFASVTPNTDFTTIFIFQIHMSGGQSPDKSSHQMGD